MCHFTALYVFGTVSCFYGSVLGMALQDDTGTRFRVND